MNDSDMPKKCMVSLRNILSFFALNIRFERDIPRARGKSIKKRRGSMVLSGFESSIVVIVNAKTVKKTHALRSVDRIIRTVFILFFVSPPAPSGWTECDCEYDIFIA